MLTKAEAKTKWCPYTKVGFPGANRVMDNEGIEPACKCLASGCMAWRWNLVRYEITGTGQELGIEYVRKINPEDPRKGFCGIAGKPE